MVKQGNSKNNIGKIIGTVAVWVGTASICYALGSLDSLSGLGAVLFIFGSLALTGAIWAKN